MQRWWEACLLQSSTRILQMVSEIILGQESEIVDVSSLGENRFKEGQLIQSRYDMQVLA